jgi:GTP cyclohydrolase I
MMIATCFRCGVSLPLEPSHHDIHIKQLCDSCWRKLRDLKDVLSDEFVGIYKVEQGMTTILEGLRDTFGLDIEDENFKDTPRRVARAYAEIFRGIKDTDLQVQNILNTSFPSTVSEMIVVKDIKAFSMCPHHFLPVEYDIAVAYISKDRVLGISKLARLAELLAKRPVLQETFTEDIAERLYTGIGAQGVGVYVEGAHSCMRMRGAGQVNSKTITSALRGSFMESAVRGEFLSLISKGGTL